ncbi:MAG: cytochrome d ubiquinol oxidase subunit II [Desulfobacteraceae bacterium A6]|nr:MAG: cytochrome d ubiquinol oxidase subunit II [Desulfobacteraceae bacterium A6]
MDLQGIWFFLWGLLWAIFFMTDGFDFGIGILYPFLGKNDSEKRIMINSVGPIWNGNEVWLITAGGVTFAAFPIAYSIMFSSLYSALMLILFALIIRGVAFEFRGKVDKKSWRDIWDIAIFVGSLLPALLFGIVFANIFKGLPLDKAGIFQGSFFDLLNFYGILGGLLFLILFLFHGSIWLSIKTEGELHERSKSTALLIWPFLLITAVLFLGASWYFTKLYNNYLANPILFSDILLTVAALFASRFFIKRKEFFKAWFSSSIVIVGSVFFGIIGLYPNMLPSSISADFSVTAFNASSSPLTLKIMLVVVIIFIPAVIAYQAWAYYLFRGKVTKEDLAYEESY